MAITPVVGAGYIKAVQDLADQINAGGSSVQAADITDSTTVGRAVLTAVNAGAARTAIGTVEATTSVAGIVKQSAAQANSVATDAAGIVTDFNALLAKLRTAGILAP